MSLTLSTQPGFTEVADSTFDVGNAVSDSALKAVNAASKFAAVRNEQFFGYYKHGETVVLPVSAADGYAYGRSELLYTWARYWTGPPASACGGTMTGPTRGHTSAPGELLEYGDDINQASGLVSCQTDYWTGSVQTVTNDGVLLVVTHAQRSR
jgi:hypothetical protein